MQALFFSQKEVISVSHLAEGELRLERGELFPGEPLVLVLGPGVRQDQPRGLRAPAGIEVGQLDGGRHSGGGAGGQGLVRKASLGLPYLIYSTYCVLSVAKCSQCPVK